MTRRLTTRLRALGVVFLLGLTACGADTTSATSPEPTASPDDTPTAVEGMSCEEQTGGDESAAMFLTDVQVTATDGYDRITFGFRPREGEEAKVPHWTIGPTDPPLREDGSGNEITVEGDAYLQAIIWATGVDLSGATFEEVYTGPDSFTPDDTATVQELRKAGDFENVLTWYVGMDRDACFRVEEMTDPVRIVVDVEA